MKNTWAASLRQREKAEGNFKNTRGANAYTISLLHRLGNSTFSPAGTCEEKTIRHEKLSEMMSPDEYLSLDNDDDLSSWWALLEQIIDFSHTKFRVRILLMTGNFRVVPFKFPVWLNKTPVSYDDDSSSTLVLQDKRLQQTQFERCTTDHIFALRKRQAYDSEMSYDSI